MNLWGEIAHAGLRPGLWHLPKRWKDQGLKSVVVFEHFGISAMFMKSKVIGLVFQLMLSGPVVKIAVILVRARMPEREVPRGK